MLFLRRAGHSVLPFIQNSFYQHLRFTLSFAQLSALAAASSLFYLQCQAIAQSFVCFADSLSIKLEKLRFI